MLRARDGGICSDIEIHLEGETQGRQFVDEIYRRGLTPDDLDEALRKSAGDGFKVCWCCCCCGCCFLLDILSVAGLYLVDTRKALRSGPAATCWLRDPMLPFSIYSH